MVHNAQAILFQKVEDKAKDTAELKKIETEQRAATTIHSSGKMKDQCIKTLGYEFYQKLYECMKNLKMQGVEDFNESEEFKKLACDKCKKDWAFYIDQILEKEFLS